MYLDTAYIGTLIIHYRVSKYAPALEELKQEVDLYHYTGDRMPGVLRQLAHDEMQRDTPYQMPKGRGNIDIAYRNKHVGYMVASRDGTIENSSEQIADNLGMTENQVRNRYRDDKTRDKLLLAEWHNILDPLPDADREEILNGLEPHFREMLKVGK